MPKLVTKRIDGDYDFLSEGTELTETYINSLPSVEEQEIAHQLNRRTEFRVLRTDFGPAE